MFVRIFVSHLLNQKGCKHLRDNRNSAFQYFKLHQISSRRSPSSKSNKWAITISVYFFNIWHKYSWAKKIKPVQPKLCLPISPVLTRIDLYVIAPSSMEEFVRCSKDKITCKTDLHFCELWWKQENFGVLFPSPPLLS